MHFRSAGVKFFAAKLSRMGGTLDCKSVWARAYYQQQCDSGQHHPVAVRGLVFKCRHSPSPARRLNFVPQPQRWCEIVVDSKGVREVRKSNGQTKMLDTLTQISDSSMARSATLRWCSTVARTAFQAPFVGRENLRCGGFSNDWHITSLATGALVVNPSKRYFETDP